MSVIKVGAIQNTSGVEVHTAKAWCNWNGRATPPSIFASGNVSSLTDSGTGIADIVFANAMPNINYAGAGSVTTYAIANYAFGGVMLHGDRTTGPALKTTSSVRTITTWASTLDESLDVSFVIMR